MSTPARDTDPVAAFLDAMASAGVHMDLKSPKGPHPVADGKLHRANALGKKNKSNQHIWYVLHVDEPASGAFGDLAAGLDETWTAGRSLTVMTPAERAVLRDRMAATRREREAETAALHAAAATAATAIMKASKAADPAHPYLAKKGLPPFPGLRQLAANVSYVIEDGEPPRTARAGSLVVPLYNPDKALVSVQLIANDGTKRFLKGTPKAGNYCSIGKVGPTIVIGEGYSTCARIHEATGHLVVVAFDSGNLAAVAAAIRRKYPDADLIIAADNDRFTSNGDIVNPGLTFARKAAEAVGALLALPLFRDDDDASRAATDFDDLARIDGVEAVAEAIAAACAPNVVDFAAERARRQAPDDAPAPPLSAYEDAFAAADEPDHDEPRPGVLDDFGAPHFRCLGVDKLSYFFQPRRVAEVIEIPASSLKAATFIRLAPLIYWQTEFPAKSNKEGGVDWHAAINATSAACLARGKFSTTEIVRGRGAWFEGETPIFHAGDRLVIGGVETPIEKHRSRFVYDEGDRIDIALDSPLGLPEAREFLDICKTLRWSSPLSGYMAAGLCVIAPVCGFLRWRPHVWVSGPAGSGKSTVIENIILAAVGDMALAVKGSASTEPGIRRELRADARPVVFDESEPKDPASRERLRTILDFARVAASEGRGGILKAAVGTGSSSFRARSMFVFASINVQIEGYADDTRITPLTLTKPDNPTPEESANAQAHYETLKARISGLVTPTFAKRLLARTIHHLPELRENVRVFTTAAAIHLGDQRLGDQAGPLLAGAFLLNSAKVVDVKAALDWIRSQDWGAHSAKDSSKDGDRFVQTLMLHSIKALTPEGGTWERTVGELMLLRTLEPGEHGYDEKQVNGAERALKNLGIKIIKDDGTYLAVIAQNSPTMKSQIFRNTEWAGAKFQTLLAAVEGATPAKTPQYFSAGLTSRAYEIPLSSLVGVGDR